MSFILIFVLSACSLVSSYLDVDIGEYSFCTVLAELARCLSLFPNLHTVQIDVSENSRPRRLTQRSMGDIFEQIFKKYSYPQIRNVFIMHLSSSFIASCPRVRRVGLTRNCSMSLWSLEIMPRDCPQLEVLDIGDLIWKANMCDCA